MKLSEYIDLLIAKGKCCFSLDEAHEALNKKRSLVVKAINHQKKLGRIASPAKGFYVIVSPEYRIYGCLPAEYFIPYLMQYWQQSGPQEVVLLVEQPFKNLCILKMYPK